MRLLQCVTGIARKLCVQKVFIQKVFVHMVCVQKVFVHTVCVLHEWMGVVCVCGTHVCIVHSGIVLQ